MRTAALTCDTLRELPANVAAVWKSLGMFEPAHLEPVNFGVQLRHSACGSDLCLCRGCELHLQGTRSGWRLQGGHCL